MLLFTAALVAVSSSSVVPAVEDFHYPAEEHAELEAVSSIGLTVVALSIHSNSTGVLTLSTANGTSATAHAAGEWVFGWRLRGFLSADGRAAAAVRGAGEDSRATATTTSSSPSPAAPAPAPLAVLEYEADRWGRLEFVALGGRVGATSASTSASASASVPAAAAPSVEGGAGWAGLALRKGVGRIDKVRRPRYNLVGADPDYFTKAEEDPTDWIKQSMENASAFGETTFEAAASRMVPTQEYAITGNANAHTKFSVAPDGRVGTAHYPTGIS